MRNSLHVSEFIDIKGRNYRTTKKWYFYPKGHNYSNVLVLFRSKTKVTYRALVDRFANVIYVTNPRLPSERTWVTLSEVMLFVTKTRLICTKIRFQISSWKERIFEYTAKSYRVQIMIYVVWRSITRHRGIREMLMQIARRTKTLSRDAQLKQQIKLYHDMNIVLCTFSSRKKCNSDSCLEN